MIAIKINQIRLREVSTGKIIIKELFTIQAIMIMAGMI